MNRSLPDGFEEGGPEKGGVQVAQKANERLLKKKPYVHMWEGGLRYQREESGKGKGSPPVCSNEKRVDSYLRRKKKQRPQNTLINTKVGNSLNGETQTKHGRGRGPDLSSQNGSKTCL